MSFGFGFALPAYPLRGGGGNNPFNQTGPTLDLSFVDGATNVGDQLGPDTYTLNTDFITPEYQVAAQYAIWENGVGLAQKTFSQIVTFSRTSGATWFNSAGVNVGIDFSTSSVTIGTGSKTFTLTATAGVDRSWTAGDIVRISEQATPANFMDGTVTSYTASTQTLVVNVTATGGSGTIASWRVSNWMPRFDYDPATLLARGLLIEESRTNSIRNNTMQGAVVGTPGTLPTNWTAVGTGLAFNVVGLGTEAGLPYIDIQVVGTTGGTSAGIRFDTNTGIAAVAGQTWTSSAYARMVAGSTTNISAVSINCSFLDAGAGIINSTSVSFASTISQPSLPLARRTVENVVAGVGTLYARSQIIIGYASGVAIDITLRIGLPQLELGAFATSVIPTTVAAATRNADQASVNTLSPWWNASEGTFYVEGSAGSLANSPIFVMPHDGTSNNYLNSPLLTTTGLARLAGVVGGAAWTNVNTANSTTANTTFKSASAFKAGDQAICLNAGTVATGVNASVPVVTTVKLGDWRTSGNSINGYLRRITYYPRRLSNADLQTITT